MLYVKKEDRYKGAFTRTNFNKGQILLDLSMCLLIRDPSRTSIQVHDGFHVEHEGGACINPACNPSCKIEGLSVVALRDLKEDEEVTFNYNENEDVLANPFECKCCGKMILGRKHE